MKKRMLITAIVMVVVLAVALTTSSLAWFSASQNDVTATGGSFKAAKTSSDNVNIAISDTLGNFRSTGSLSTKTGPLLPACPTAQINTFPSEMIFNSRRVIGGNFSMDANGLENETINFDVDKGGETVTSDDAQFYYQDALYVVNYDDTTAVNSITLNIESKVTAATGFEKATPFMLVRLAKRSAVTDSPWSEVGYNVVKLDTTADGYIAYDFADLTASADVKQSSQTQANIEANRFPAVVSTAETKENFDLVASLTFSNLALAVSAGEYLKIDIVMWFDGAALNASTQQTNVAFMMTVTGA